MNELNFRDLNISTITINVESNLFFNLSQVMTTMLNVAINTGDTALDDTRILLAEQKELSHTEYKKQKHPGGTISYICYKNVWRGLKRKKKKLLKKRNDFVNQVTLDIFIDNDRRINVMLFRNGRIKLAGCKTSNDAIIAVLRLHRILKICVVLQSPLASFLFRNEMINISFAFPFTINKVKVNQLFNRLVSDCISFYEQTGQQYVNVKMFGNSSNSKKAIKLEGNKISVVDIPSSSLMKTCFMLFEKRVIMSGVDYKLMEVHFRLFREILDKNRKEISC